MTHDDKLVWMVQWAARNNAVLALEGECGFGRACVGVLAGNSGDPDEVIYPDYEWYDEGYTKRLDDNGIVWTPKDTYHIHPCVAVLGRGEPAEAQLYDWLQWFDNNGFVLEAGTVSREELMRLGPIEILLCKHLYARMVKKPNSTGG